MTELNKLTCKKILLIPAKITNENIYSECGFDNSCRECIRKSYCPYAELIPKYKSMCIQFSVSRQFYTIDDDHLNLYVPVGMDRIYSKIMVEGKQCVN